MPEVDAAASPTPEGATRGSVWEVGERAVSLKEDGAVNVGGCADGDLDLLIRLLTHEDTADLAQRQLVVLRRVCKLRRRGFRYGELLFVEQLLPLIEGRVVGVHASEFRTPFLKFLDLCSLAPVRDRANEEFTERGLAASSSLFRVLGVTLWSPDGGIQIATADVLRKIAAGNDPTRPSTRGDGEHKFSGECPHDLRPKSRDINQALLLECGVVTSAVACLGDVIASVLESLANMDDLSLESSSFGDSEASVENAATASSKVADVTTKPAHEQEKCVAAAGQLVQDDGSPYLGCKGEPQITQTDDDDGEASKAVLKYTVLLSLLYLIRELSTNATSSAAMVEAGVVSLLVQAMRAVRGVRDPTLSTAVEVMWNCLEHSQNEMVNGAPAACRTSLIQKARKTNAAFVLSTWDSVSALRDTIESLLVEGFRNKDKELRNEAIIVASQLVSNARSHSLFRITGMLLLLLRYATAIETGLGDGDPLAAESEARTRSLAGDEASSNNNANLERRDVPELGPLADPRNFATMAEVDMELKLLLWSLLADLSKQDSRNLEVIKASPLMETLLMYMDLVVEEGQSADEPPPGMSRSVSLASMPTLGTGQTAFAACGTAAPSLNAAGDLGQHPSVDPETGTHRPPAFLPPRGSTPISGDDPTRQLDQHLSSRKEEKLAPPAQVAGADLNTWASDAVSVPEAEDGESAVAPTNLYVPATVVRLPITSIKLLQGQAMASLLVIAPRCPRKFQALGGHMVTLRLLDRLGSRPENQRLVKVATKMLATVVGLPGLKEELGRVDGVKVMLDRFSDESRREPYGCDGSGGGGGQIDGGSGGSGGDDLRTDTVIILCRLCNDCPENQEAFRKADGVPTMMAAVRAYCQTQRETKQQEGSTSSAGGGGGGGSSLGLGESAGGLGSETSTGESLDPSLVHVVDCIWCAVVGNRRSEARLLQCEGLDTLLDLLEICPVFMRHQVTGIVADLLRNKRSIPYARAWRSDLNMLTITQLMVRLWVAEEARLGVSRPNGVLQNLWQPLQSHGRGPSHRNKREQTSRRAKSSRPASAANVDPASTTSGANLRAKPSGAVTITAGHSEENLDPHDTSLLTRSPEERVGIGEEPSAPGNAEETCGVPEAITLALQAGKRAAGSGLRGNAGQGKGASNIGPESSVAKAMRHLDLRGKIAAVLGMVGFDRGSKEGLGPSDLKALYMATNYQDFREGETWQEIAGELEAQQVNPIAADALVLDTMLERSFDCAQEVKSKQVALTAEQRQRDGETEKAFFASILFQRDQETRQAILKRNASMPGTTKKRLAAKKAKENMVKLNGGGASRGGSGDTGMSLGQGSPEGDVEAEGGIEDPRYGDAGLPVAG